MSEFVVCEFVVSGPGSGNARGTWDARVAVLAWHAIIATLACAAH
jgi:hypothetical protein